MANATQEQIDEMRRITQENVCSCGAELQIRTNPEKDCLEVGCPIDRSHQGYIERTTYTQDMRRGAVVPVYFENQVNKRMLPNRTDLDRAIAMLKTRFPAADMDHPSAALFIMNCWRLDIDPFLGEVVPVTFASKGKKVVVTIITEDGMLSMAARGCPEKWAGTPMVEPVTDPELRKAICGESDAWVWKATGRTKDMAEGQTTSAYGWFKQWEQKKADSMGTPAADLPGNQARVRAIKRWIRENMPEAKHRMVELTSEMMERAEGVTMALEVIDAEYRVLPPGEEEDGKDKKTTGPDTKPKQKGGSLTEAQLNYIIRLAKERLGLTEAQALDSYKGLTKKAATALIEDLRAMPPENWVKPTMQDKEQKGLFEE